MTKFNTDSPFWYGLRHNSDQPKAQGYFGEIPIPGTNDKATEYSIDVNIGGKNIQIPTIVPTLTTDELEHLKQIIASDAKMRLPDNIVNKAIEHAQMRIGKGLSPFWSMPEKQYKPSAPNALSILQDTTWEPPLFPDTTR